MHYLVLTLDYMAVEPTFEYMPRRGFVDEGAGYPPIGVLDFVCAALSEKPSSITFRWAILPCATATPVLLSLSEGSSAI